MPNDFLLPPDAQARHDMLGRMQADAKQKRDAADPRSGAQTDDSAQSETPSRRSNNPRE